MSSPTWHLHPVLTRRHADCPTPDYPTSQLQLLHLTSHQVSGPQRRASLPQTWHRVPRQSPQLSKCWTSRLPRPPSPSPPSVSTRAPTSHASSPALPIVISAPSSSSSTSPSAPATRPAHPSPTPFPSQPSRQLCPCPHPSRPCSLFWPRSTPSSVKLLRILALGALAM